MTIMRFVDSAPVSGIRRTADGYAVAEVPVARTGTQVYAGFEVGRPDMAKAVGYRPPDAVFADGFLASMAHKPVTDNHPADAVTSANWRELAHGYTGDTIRKDEAAGLIYVPLLLADEAAIQRVENGDKREVSCGYTCDVEWTAGTTPEGEAYDFIQRPSALNHVALVLRGRAGSSCRVGDSWQPLTDKEPGVATKTITFDGLPVEATDASEAVINKLIAARDSLKGELATAIKDGADANTAHDKAIAAKDAEIADLKGKVADQAAIDALADAKAEVVTQAKAIVGDSFDGKGKTIAAIRREVVKAKGVTVDGKSDDYVEAYFETLKPAVSDAFRDTVRDGVVSDADADKAVADARTEMLQALFNPHKADA